MSEKHAADNAETGVLAQSGHVADSSQAADEAGGRDKPARSRARLALTMASLCMAVFLVALDITIITTALPAIAEHFDNPSAFTWISSSYMLATAASTLIWGKLSDVFGRKPALLFSNALFFIGSLLAALSVSMTMLIVGRVVQGIGGGGLIALTNICVGDLFSPRSRGAFYGVISGVWAVANSLGPIIGGAFTSKLSWRWCFWINLPFDGLAFGLLVLFLDLKTPKTPFIAGIMSIDWLGALLTIGATLMLLIGLEYGGVTFPWGSATVVCLIVFGLVAFVLFILCEMYLAQNPIMPMRLVNNRSNLAALAACAIHGFVFISASFYIPFFLQATHGYSALKSGVLLLPTSVSLSVVSVGTGLFIKKTGNYTLPMLFGFLFMTLGWGLFIDWTADAGLAKLIVYQIIAGIGIGGNIQAPMIALQAGSSPKDLATATALYGLVRNLATAVSIVVGGVVYQNELVKHSHGNAALSSIANANGEAGAGSSVGIVQSLQGSARYSAEMAISDSLRSAWIMYTVLAATGIISWVFIQSKELSHKHEEVETGLEAEKKRREES
ncbi:hypothetical protein LLEC1_02493 [Akanthomyces lecanii]|uniref:Major facilitator superfamily (MFS) profile domain-containing protein n=1 Tax=Cordyceps confragosa TaxID=2714763 RepID=A0A179ISE6_CORDF|nr:hypothetical protein LLEC1_02493 [Akanthomyces lecanii]